jgi:TonB family protein
MQKSHFPLLLSVLFALPVLLAAQPEAQRVLGELPSTFQLPEAGMPVRFSSMLNPEYQVPEYPAQHLKDRFEGVAELQLFVTRDGDVVRSEVTVSSGDELFDLAALRSALRTRFPAGYAMLHGQACDFAITVPYYFLLSPDPEQYWHMRLELARIQQEYEVQMKQFQALVGVRNPAAAMQLQRTQRQLEETITIAKGLHRSLAEKKEAAILRLRDEISMTKQRLETPAVAAADQGNASWRTAQTVIPTVIVPGGTKGVSSINALSNNELDRLMNELELKQSYL